MNPQRVLTFGITGIVAAGVVASILATMTMAASTAYSVKVKVTDKIQSANIFEGIILEQTKGKTSILADKMNFRVVSSTLAYNKSGTKRSVKNWMSSVQNDDLVTVVGQYKKSDNTFEVGRAVNRSR